MAQFFIPSLSDGGPGAERTYRELRDRAEMCTGAVSRERRIEGLLCRRSGRDCQLRVGEVDDGNGRTVSAIIQLGRATFTIHHVGPHPGQPSDPVVLNQSDVYSITDFH